jgi:hypothetical protein
MPLGLATASSCNICGLPGGNRTSFGFRLFWVPRNVSPNFDVRLNVRCVVSCSVMRGLVLMFGWMCEVGYARFGFDIRLDVRGLLSCSVMRGLVLMFGWMCEVCFDVRLNVRCVVSCSVECAMCSFMFGYARFGFDVRLDVRGLF